METLIRIFFRYPPVRKIEVISKKIELTDEVEIVYEKRITPFGNSAKVDAPKKYIGKRAYVIILKE
jgi:putative transposon-encoded protein